MLATLTSCLTLPLRNETNSSLYVEKCRHDNTFRQSNLPPSAKYAWSSVISFWRENLQLRFIMRWNLHTVIKLWIVWLFTSGIASLKTVVRLCMMIRGAEDFLRCFLKSPDPTTRIHHRNPRISETVCEVGPKTADRPTQVKLSGSRTRDFGSLQTPWGWISPLHR